MSDQSEQVEAQAAQRAHSRRATIERMRAKKPPVDEFEIDGPDGEPMSFRFVGIGSIAYDKLVSECPPTTEQMARGLQVNQDKLFSLLLNKVSEDPALSVEEWDEVARSPEWTRGEIMDLYNRAAALCLRGLDIRPTVAD